MAPVQARGKARIAGQGSQPHRAGGAGRIGTMPTLRILLRGDSARPALHCPDPATRELVGAFLRGR